MPADEDRVLVVPLRGPGWRDDVEVRRPTRSRPPAIFHVPMTNARDAPIRPIVVQVRYTEGVSRRPGGWDTWHVKIYRCANEGEADALRRYLRRQTSDIQRANAQVEGPSRIPIQPPWAVVPVQIVGGDGQIDNLDGSTFTEPGIDETILVERTRSILPSWFDDPIPVPELYLLAFSPWMQRLSWDPFLTNPGIEHLVDFLSLAKGLDVLHLRGTVHCDIKPDNVCRYNTPRTSGYVLIDADAAARVDPVPIYPRTSEPYVYQGIRAWRDRQTANRERWQRSGRDPAHFVPEAIDPAMLWAQDRFSFALVVLVALAGRDWVESTLLATQDDEGQERRRADDPDAVMEELARHWPATATRDWTELITTVSEPFTSDIEVRRWSAADWIERLIGSERRCVRVPPEPAPDHSHPHRRDLALILSAANRSPAPGPERVTRVYAAIQRRAETLALRAAVIAALTAAAVPILLALFIVVSKFGLEK